MCGQGDCRFANYLFCTAREHSPMITSDRELDSRHFSMARSFHARYHDLSRATRDTWQSLTCRFRIVGLKPPTILTIRARMSSNDWPNHLALPHR